ncbi:patatin-like phospholipase family protein [Nereida sp. MMG025]|uniref:patatin-like phospholipase family protein n=1 Tax=Nereida sp. MMG025 TaxID=2909981 RepID=UPI001F3AD37A|nr:patatin-like phospholipase family protein [Nereida sp. MMG025]MCF6443293.1 patatin-like phospholipase family protein [Nereida sp. MMG025]
MTVKRINLALQGGGAHGAFTWGVLDRLLDEERLEIAAITGTSAGALNGAALKSGMVAGGRAGARENLDWLWGQVGAINDPVFAGWLSLFGGAVPALSKGLESSWPFMVLDSVSRMSSPYALGAFYRNPLERIVERFAYDRVCAKDGPRLHVCATNVRTGKIRVFDESDICAEAIMASACLPTLFKAVELHDPASDQIEAYWDGGYTGNPALFPLFEGDLPPDVVVVNINPLSRSEVPKTGQAIQNRINEISFNSSLLRELRAIAFVQRLLKDGAIKRGTMKNIHVHMIADDALMNDLGVATKLIPQPVILGKLKEAGRAAADAFLDAHWDQIGQESSVDLPAMFR